MKELGWRQESLTNSSSRPPIQIRSHDQRTLHEEEEVPANFSFHFFNDKEALGPPYPYKGFNKKEIVGSKWTFPISMADCIPRTFLID